MTALQAEPAHNACDVLNAMGVREASPLGPMSEGVRWRRQWPDGGHVWLDLSGVFFADASLPWSLEGVCTDALETPIHVSRLGVSLKLPPSGFDAAGQFDWSVAARMLLSLPGSASVRLAFMQMQAESFCRYLNLSDIQWFPESRKGGLQQNEKSLRSAVRTAVLGYESPQGAVWLLRAPRHYLLSWWRSCEHLPAAHIVKRMASRLIRQPQYLTLSLPLAPLTATIIGGLEAGSIIRFAQSRQPDVLSAPVELTTQQKGKSQPFPFTAALELCVRPEYERDRIDLQWRYFMLPPDHPNPDANSSPMVTERIAGRLTCVIADIELTLEDLLNLQPGDLLPSVSISTPVLELRIGDQYVGSGELVRLGDILAVQLIEWNMSDTGAQGHEQPV